MPSIDGNGLTKNLIRRSVRMTVGLPGSSISYSMAGHLPRHGHGHGQGLGAAPKSSIGTLLVLLAIGYIGWLARFGS